MTTAADTVAVAIAMRRTHLSDVDVPEAPVVSLRFGRPVRYPAELPPALTKWLIHKEPSYL